MSNFPFSWVGRKVRIWTSDDDSTTGELIAVVMNDPFTVLVLDRKRVVAWHAVVLIEQVEV